MTMEIPLVGLLPWNILSLQPKEASVYPLVHAGRSGLPEISGRVFSGYFQFGFSDLTPEIVSKKSKPDISGSGFPDLPKQEWCLTKFLAFDAKLGEKIERCRYRRPTGNEVIRRGTTLHAVEERRKGWRKADHCVLWRNRWRGSTRRCLLACVEERRKGPARHSSMSVSSEDGRTQGMLLVNR